MLIQLPFRYTVSVPGVTKEKKFCSKVKCHKLTVGLDNFATKGMEGWWRHKLLSNGISRSNNILRESFTSLYLLSLVCAVLKKGHWTSCQTWKCPLLPLLSSVRRKALFGSTPHLRAKKKGRHSLKNASGIPFCKGGLGGKEREEMVKRGDNSKQAATSVWTCTYLNACTFCSLLQRNKAGPDMSMTRLFPDLASFKFILSSNASFPQVHPSSAPSPTPSKRVA